MNDALSPLRAPPPRYLLESDSSDEEGQGAYPSSSRKPARIAPSHTVQINLNSKTSEFALALVAMGQVGRYVIRKGGAGKVVGEVRTEDEVIGRFYEADGGIVVVMEERDGGEATFAIAGRLLRTIRARSWLVISTYVPSMYIPDPSFPSSSSPTPPIRHLPISSHSPSPSPGVELFRSPNYVTGLPAALATNIAHPASHISPEMPVNLLLLPLPLSSLSVTSLASALGPFSSALSRAILRPSAPAWEEDDDEPFSAPGMGGGRRIGKRKDRGQEKEGMGMYT